MADYILKVYPKGYGREVYRIFPEDGSSTLDDLAEHILHEFDFDDDHLYEFCMNCRIYSGGVTYQKLAFGERHLRGVRSTDEVTLDDLGLVKGQKFLFHYDFGDDWQFMINVQAVDSPNDVRKSLGKIQQYNW